jgi:hypothetical protein
MIRPRTRNFYKLCFCAVLKKVSKDESSAAPFFNTTVFLATWQRDAALPEKMLSSENLSIWRFKVFVGD